MVSRSKVHSYHHGQLRRALLDAAIVLVDERGIQGFTLREVARRAGVSHAAPYHHFTDKSALVEALVIESYKQFGEALEAAFVNTPGPSINKLIRVGVAYVRYAIDHSASFRLMFRPELYQQNNALPFSDAPTEAVRMAGMHAFHVLVAAIAACQAEGLVRAGDPYPLTLAAWSMTHGLAMLLIDGGLAKFPVFDTSDPARLTAMVTDILAAGMLVR